ncbi:hypothetical protein [Rhodobacter capsulatus]|jgi:hypothetical protein|uniref:Uncharacterized protein n=1 Tax=Rhodobacter capsulatus (strain ATCC BAA-309 / NBRC 16581 / SB1003) TaxID=272942 RepID=D5ALJ2_RHOCB|nr:hypothetical protein [Rhodobacter capsulatus]ADE86053.1 hypothetical protein RCAP_rcc02323 [Rhodobacter capsulatus SB 1003]ETD01314.1 hypothetical protein U714_12935 [Rhodobacter capsulatus DE442]ETD75894.1 hypothetical protein U717_13100 [Rhodobacter capsulatus R121]ETD80038.1 hypothetical protein U716_14455 [Rhodobacter capsulatus B6]ETD84172.1 hypothetical protein U703_06095 [Rhodobacter capsulatus YW1]
MSDDDVMDKKRQKAADKIITRMTEEGASPGDIKIQKKANKDAFGHEGECDAEAG